MYDRVQIEDANEGVGGWGEQTRQFTRIKERRIVLCLDNSTAAINSTAGASSTTHGKPYFLLRLLCVSR